VEIDHVFMLVEPDGADLHYLKSLGLIETYRRTHVGQGTQNICFCFDNMFLECLWVNDVGALRTDVIARTGLYERSQWRRAGTNPFGIAVRKTVDDEQVNWASWTFRPPYLPVGMSIDVSVDGDDPRQPMIFSMPGTPPSQWPAERRRDLQKPAGLGRILAIRLDMPETIVPSPALKALAQSTCLEIGSSSGHLPALTCDVERLDHDRPLIVRLPV
jgi:hypothetical protein